MLCLQDVGEAQTYYLRHRRGIRLVLPDRNADAAAWPRALQSGSIELLEQALTESREPRVTGRWRLMTRSESEMAGEWTDPTGGRPTPITLARVPTREQHDPRMPGTGCASAFYDPLRAAVRTKASPARLGERAYQELSSEQGTSFEVPGDTPHAQRLNRHALEWLRNQAAVAFDCDLNRGGAPAPLGSSLRPVVWTDRYLVLEDLLPDTYCGGAHGFSSLSYTTWSVQQGRMVDTWTWLRGGSKALVAHEGRDGKTIRSGLFRLVARSHPRNVSGDDCSESIEHMSIEAPYPTAEGLVFNTTFPHAVRACNDEVKLGWKQLAPYLSDAGRAALEVGR